MLHLIKDLLSIPAILVGIMALLGLVLQRKNTPDIIKGTLKTILGFIILGGGASIIVAALNPFSLMVEEGFNIQGVVPNNEAIVALSVEHYANTMALVMIFGMVFNILLARFGPLKYIFLTGHHTFYLGTMITVVLAVGGLSGTWLVLVGSFVLGLCMVIFPALAQPFMKKITGNDDIALAHFSTVGYIASGYIGMLFKNKSKSTEDINFPPHFNFLKDSLVSISLTMGFLYVVAAIASGQQYVELNLSDGQHYIIYALLQGITFASGIYIALQGVRLFLAEVVPAFKGIAEKLVPNAKPALDCPVVFTFAPNAVLIGFLSSFAGGIVSLFVLGFLSWTLILPGVIPHFFTGATAGVFGNATGGRKGAVVGAFINGVIITFLPLALLPVLGDLGFANATFSDTDFGVVGIILGGIISFFN